MVAKKLSIPVDSLKTAYYETSDGTDGVRKYREVIAVAASINDIRDHVELIRRSGMTVKAIDTRAAAISRCLIAGREATWASAPILVLDVSEDHGLLIFIRNDMPIFVRRLSSAGLTEIRSQDSDKVGMLNPRSRCCTLNEQALDRYAATVAREIQLCSHHLAERGIGVDGSCFGCVAGLVQAEPIVRSLNEHSDVTFHPLQGCLSPAFLSAFRGVIDRRELSAWLVPVGLALYGIEDIPSEQAA
jgi:hypothetical protein